jgi:hypothetical protein
MANGYGVSSRDYLARAEYRLAEGTPEALFYAAFELRCGIEARLQEYLHAQEHLTKKQKEGWRVAALGATASKTFKIGDKVARYTIYDRDKGDLLAILYYTPVTRALKGYAGKLSNYLHAVSRFHPQADPWWAEFRALLEATRYEIRRSTRGNLLGAPLQSPSGQIKMYTEMEKRPEWTKKGRRIVFRVEYLSEYPSELEVI